MKGAAICPCFFEKYYIFLEKDFTIYHISLRIAFYVCISMYVFLYKPTHVVACILDRQWSTYKGLLKKITNLSHFHFN